MARFGTYNLLDMAGPGVGARYELVVEVIRSLGLDVLAVQEVLAPGEGAAGEALAGLAADVGMVCHYEPGRAAVAVGHKLSRQPAHHCVGLLWRPEAQAVPGTFVAIGTSDFWHGLVAATFDFGGPKVTFASYHAPPFGRHMRADQAERVVSVTQRSAPALVGADWNCISADRRPGGGRYDHDWHAHEAWADHLVFQCLVEVDDNGARHHRIDRGPGEVLYNGGLFDAAAALDAPWQPTVGHWPSDAYDARRIDAIRVTRDVLPALRSLEVAGTAAPLGPDAARRPLAVDPRAASDHLPVVVTFDPTDLDGH